MDLAPVADWEPARIADPDREAAVLVPVVEPETELVFIRRSATLAEHPGEMSFPGGNVERTDRDRESTAIRESGEEVGLQPSEIRTIGRLDDVQTVSGYTVSPFVASVPARDYQPGDAEVDAIHRLPLAKLTDPNNHAFEPREHPVFGTVPCHHFHVEGHTIWGATARMLVQLLGIGTDWSVQEPAAPTLGDLVAKNGVETAAERSSSRR